MKIRDLLRRHILDTLKKERGNRTKTAKALGMSIRTLTNHVRRYTEEGYAVPPPAQGGRAASKRLKRGEIAYKCWDCGHRGIVGDHRG